jgi:hypothetical protein
MIDFEKMSGHAMGFENIQDALMLFYCLNKAGTGKEFTLSFDQFLDEIDNHPEALTQIYQAISAIVAGKKK